jgi:hypothetical protein
VSLCAPLSPLVVPTKIRKLLHPIYESEGRKFECCECKLEFNPQKGLIPRAMIGANNGLNDVELIVVGKNPGRPYKQLEQDAYSDAQKNNPTNEADALFSAMVKFCEKRHLEPTQSYHKNLMAFLLYLLNPKGGEKEVLNRVYFTELIKCSFDEGDEDRRLFSPKHGDYKFCREHLAKELSLFPKAKAIAALGHQVQDALFLYTQKKVVYVPHPSRVVYPNKKYETATKELRKLLP